MEWIQILARCQVYVLKWLSVNKLSFFRHPMERLESLYANKFTNIQKHEPESSDLCPGKPFKGLVRNIISKRIKSPREEFKYSLTPNEFVKKVADPWNIVIISFLLQICSWWHQRGWFFGYPNFFYFFCPFQARKSRFWGTKLLFWHIFLANLKICVQIE